jgi:hypothetical protein
MLCSFELVTVQITHYNPKTCITGLKEYMGSTKICLGTTRHILHGQKGNLKKRSSTVYCLQQLFFQKIFSYCSKSRDWSQDGQFSKKFAWPCCLGFFIHKLLNFPHKKKTHWPGITSMRTYNVWAIEQPQSFMSFWVSQKTCKTFAKTKKDLVGWNADP